MKQTLFAISSVIALAAPAFAGSSSYVAPAQDMSSSPLYKWFAGTSVGYLIDSEEAYYTLHFGAKIAESGPISHSIYLEGGYTDLSESFVDADIIPVTLNYKLDYHFTEKFSAYAGVGAGVAFLDVDTPFGGDKSTELALQAFAGVGYDITPAFQVYGGARYIWIDDTKLYGTKVDVGDDVGIELGARFRF